MNTISAKQTLYKSAYALPIFITTEDSDVLDGNGFLAQEYALHIPPAIYPDENLSYADAKKGMKNKRQPCEHNVFLSFNNKIDSCV